MAYGPRMANAMSSAHDRPMLALGLRLVATVLFSVMLLLVKLTGERNIALPETLSSGKPCRRYRSSDGWRRAGRSGG